MTRPLIGSLMLVRVMPSGIGFGEFVDIAQVTSVESAYAVDRLFGGTLHWSTLTKPPMKLDEPVTFPQREAVA